MLFLTRTGSQQPFGDVVEGSGSLGLALPGLVEERGGTLQLRSGQGSKSARRVVRVVAAARRVLEARSLLTVQFTTVFEYLEVGGQGRVRVV